MDIQQRAVGDVVVLSILGDITMTGSGVPRVADTVRRVIQEGHTRLVLDLGHVRYVDSAGLGDLVQAQSAARNRSAAVKLVNVNKRLNDLLVLTKLVTVFDCFEDEPEALASFEQATVPH
ncbi:MAG: STAS domain-containing protein [Acidobacteria bacterium]|nr:STAS domain-containing protein [Acidobacteriota bacterium]